MRLKHHQSPDVDNAKWTFVTIIIFTVFISLIVGLLNLL